MIRYNLAYVPYGKIRYDMLSPTGRPTRIDLPNLVGLSRVISGVWRLLSF